MNWLDIWSKIRRLLFGDESPSAPEAQPTVAPTVTPTPTPFANEEAFRRGFEEYGSPLATASAKFAEAANKYKLPDPYSIPTLMLMETSGGKNQKFKNNPANWGMQDMPSLDYLIDRIYSGIAGRMPYYKDYLASGDPADLLSVFTPSGVHNNPNLNTLLRRYTSLRGYFPQREVKK